MPFKLQIHVLPYRTHYPTHHLLHGFHLFLQTWQNIVRRQALLQLDDIFAVFVDL